MRIRPGRDVLEADGRAAVVLPHSAAEDFTLHARTRTRLEQQAADNARAMRAIETNVEIARVVRAFHENAGQRRDDIAETHRHAHDIAIAIIPERS